MRKQKLNLVKIVRLEQQLLSPSRDMSADYDIHKELGIYYFESSSLQGLRECEKHFKKALELRPTSITSRHFLSKLYISYPDIFSISDKFPNYLCG